jgi:hypothetical protein
MLKSIAGLDHVVLAVHDLDAAAATFARMGFTVTPRGFHSLGTQNHCVMLGSDYLELLAVPKRVHESMRYFADFLGTGEGLAAIALRGRSADRVYTEWLWAGLSPTRVIDLARPVALPDGTREARFRLTQLAAEATPGTRLFACQHLTPELIWRSEWRTHANGATAIAGVAFVADSPETLAARYGRASGARAAEMVEGFAVVAAGNAHFGFSTEAVFRQRWPDVVLPARPRPTATGLFLRGDPDRATAILTEAGFAPRRMPDGSVALGADQAHGVALFFG